MKAEGQNQPLERFKRMLLFSDISKLVDQTNSEKISAFISNQIINDDSIIYQSLRYPYFNKNCSGDLIYLLGKQNYLHILFIVLLSLLKDVLFIINLYLLDQLSLSLKKDDAYKSKTAPFILVIVIYQLLGYYLILFSTYLNGQLTYILSNFKNRLYEQTSILILQKQLKIYLYQTSNIDALVLLSDDIWQIYELFEILRKSFSGLLTFLFSLVYLTQQDQNVWQTISLTIFLAQVSNFTLCYYYITAEEKYKSYKEKRVQLMTQILYGIKQIKLLNWEKVFGEKIMGIRKLEFRQLAIMKILDGFGSVFWNNLTYILLGSYLVTQFGKGLNFEDLNIIPIMTMFNTLNFPLGILPWNINNFLVGKISYDRIVKYLKSQEVQERKVIKSENAISIDSFNFRWQKDQDQIIVNDLKLKSKTIIGLVGAIGSGKTTLIKSFLNEIQVNSTNSSIVNGTIAYCQQTPWLINDSIRNNILFGSEYKEKFYNEVLDMCQIIQDINTFLERDQRQVGLNGCKMSGGQKQRIVLARAIYQNADIYIFNDPLSNCDFEVSKKIIQRAFNFLVKSQKTIIISSNHSNYLKMMKFDRILQLVDGELQDQVLNQNQITDDDKPNIERNQIEQQDDEDINKQDEQEQEIRLSLQTWIIWFSLMGWFILLMFTITNFMMQVCFSYIDFWLKNKMEFLEQTSTSSVLNFQTIQNISNTQAIIFLVSFSLIITAIRGLFYALISITSGWYSFKKLNQSLMNSKLEFYEKTQTGAILSRTSVDTQVIDTELSGRFHVFYEDISKVSGMLFGLIYLVPNVWIILAYVVYQSFILSKRFSAYNSKLSNICTETQDQLLTFFNEIIQGTETIRVYDKQQHFSNIFRSKLQQYVQISQVQSRSQCWFQLRLNLISNFLVAIIMAYIFSIESENISQGQIILCITYSLGLFDNLNQIFTFSIDFQGLLLSFERVRQYHFIKQENLDLETNNMQKSINKTLVILSFKNVSLQYDDQIGLNNISFDIKQHQKIAIVGRTGSGKTSILNALFRLYDHVGEIIVNGIEINQINLSELRSQISIIPQSGFIFKGTLLQNLNPKSQLKSQEVISFLEKIKQQFENLSPNITNPYFEIQPNGENLSIGEKQIINILRALLQNSQIVCLDEAQSSIDLETNKIINKIFNEFTKNKTVITISHNLENFNDFDMVIVMNQGEIQQLRYRNS